MCLNTAWSTVHLICNWLQLMHLFAIVNMYKKPYSKLFGSVSEKNSHPCGQSCHLLPALIFVIHFRSGTGGVAAGPKFRLAETRIRGRFALCACLLLALVSVCAAESVRARSTVVCL